MRPRPGTAVKPRPETAVKPRPETAVKPSPEIRKRDCFALLAMTALLFFVAAVAAGCVSQRLERIEQHDGATYQTTYSVMSIPLFGGKSESVHSLETVGLNNVKIGQSANQDQTAILGLLGKMFDLMTLMKAAP